jgi:hypothetical protein
LYGYDVDDHRKMAEMVYVIAVCICVKDSNLCAKNTHLGLRLLGSLNWFNGTPPSLGVTPGSSCLDSEAHVELD